MRNELEQISIIEKYLNNELSAEEKAAFEKNLQADPQLQEALTLQQEIMKGIDNLSMKQKIHWAKKRYYRNRNITRWGLTSLIVIAVVTAIIIYSGKNKSQSSIKELPALPAFNEQHRNEWADADKKIPPQKFLITMGRDTIVETKAGMIIQVPANGFLTGDKQPVTGQIELTIKEAMDAAGIISAGLSSTSGDQLLESAGMFLIDARQNENILAVNPVAGLYLELPTDTIHPGMKLFSGKRMTDGRIDWVAPQPLERTLTPVDINQLNFYPPRYLDSLAKWGYNTNNKKFTDSLYYSYSHFFREYETAVEESRESYGANSYNNINECAINPAKIKAIWGEKYQNTLLATREFEERLNQIHQTGKNVVLDLYVNNLDKTLSEIDSMAVKNLKGAFKQRFLAFAARHDGAIKINSALTQKLRQYYDTKTKTFMDAVAQTRRAFWEKQEHLDKEANQKQTAHTMDSLKRIADRFNEELQLNLKRTYSQLGYNSPPRLPGANVYKARITATGWYNVDRIVTEATITRTTLNISDAATGKNASIRYEPVSFAVNNAPQYDDLYIYLLPEKLNSFIRLPVANDKYTERLNELIKYKLVCVGYKGEQAFYYMQPGIEPKAYTNIELQSVSASELNRLLNREGNGRHEAGIQKDLAFYLYYKKESQRQKHNLELLEFTWKVQTIIWYYRGEGVPCCCFGDSYK
ncbi:hypothetical protein [Niastella populi]|uniref:Uncharacterized protein n=1 Tax=Niastella populi TaxID=550983 RepID=A0A1V9F7P0_9BACT|nr:hypothetical protein [Niastella populi]OQP54433.1 hypothetical protein A4R26_27545 [Niastella populi]